MTAPRAGGIGCVGLVLVLAISYFTGTNPLELLRQVGQVETDDNGDAEFAGEIDTQDQVFFRTVIP